MNATVHGSFTDEQRAEIRAIVREELSRTYWRTLWADFPELAQALQKEFPALVPDLRESQTPPDSRQAVLPNP